MYVSVLRCAVQEFIFEQLLLQVLEALQASQEQVRSQEGYQETKTTGEHFAMKEQRTDKAKTILNHTVGEHIAALRQITKSTVEQRFTAREAMRKWIGTQEELAFKDVDDWGILCMFLEEFHAFGMFIAAGDDTQDEITEEDVRVIKAKAIEFLMMLRQKPGQA